MQNDDEDNKSLEDYQYFKISFSSVDGTYHAKILPANQISVVGEKGPELFIPKTSGTILPNNMLSAGSPAGLGGGSVTYNINAVDAMSFKSMIARDPSFIHAVAMQGAKGTPGRY